MYHVKEILVFLFNRGVPIARMVDAFLQRHDNYELQVVGTCLQFLLTHNKLSGYKPGIQINDKSLTRLLQAAPALEFAVPIDFGVRQLRSAFDAYAWATGHVLKKLVSEHAPYGLFETEYILPVSVFDPRTPVVSLVTEDRLEKTRLAETPVGIDARDFMEELATKSVTANKDWSPSITGTLSTLVFMFRAMPARVPVLLRDLAGDQDRISGARVLGESECVFHRDPETGQILEDGFPVVPRWGNGEIFRTRPLVWPFNFDDVSVWASARFHTEPRKVYVFGVYKVDKMEHL